MFTDRARTLSRGFVEPVALALGRIGLTPNAITFIGAALHVVVAWLLFNGRFAGGGVMLALAAGIDGLDGTLARKTGQTSSLGAFLDSTFDRISEILTFLGLVAYAEWGARAVGGAPLSASLVFLAASGSVMVSYARARSEGIGRGTKVGLLGRMERMVILVLGLVTAQVAIALWIIAVGAWLTTGFRIYDVWRQSGRTAAETRP